MKKVLFVLLAALLFVGCKKENRIEKNLWKGGGKWNIESIEYRETSSHFPADNYSEVTLNAGTMSFTKDGKASIILEEDNDAYIDHYTYQNTEDKLTLFDEDGDGIILDLEWKRNEFTLSMKSSHTYETLDENFSPITVTSTSSTKIKCKKK